MTGDINATKRIAAVESSVCPRGYYKTELAQDRWESAAPWDAWALTSSGHAFRRLGNVVTGHPDPRGAAARSFKQTFEKVHQCTPTPRMLEEDPE